MELHYTHVDKLSLAIVHAVQRLRNYILLCQTLVVAQINPFQFILTRRMIGGKYNKWIVILQEFDLVPLNLSRSSLPHQWIEYS